ncbi:uncharacterized protein [Apostichopus japonicus]|uniref:uncharacterized protein isoform X1 n=1 Tax=Stichopus japonicus TaxID=307972 RepID=UPI003AB768C3
MSCTCFKCLRTIEGGNKKLFFHLKHVHGIANKSRVKIVCSQGRCVLTFNTLCGYKKHLLTKHSSQQEPFIGVPQCQHKENNRPDIDYSNENETAPSSDADEEVAEYENITESAAIFIARLKSSGIAYSHIQRIIDDTKEFINSIVADTERKVSGFFDTHCDKSLDKVAKENLHVIFRSVHDPFKDLSSESLQRSYFHDRGALINSEEKLMGNRFKFKIDRNTGRPVQVIEKETLQYVPVKSSLKQYLERPGVMNSIMTVQSSGDPNLLKTYRDGSFFKRYNNDHREEMIVIPLLLYYDDFETANPLGAKRGIHKLGGFYISVLSLPVKYQARLDNILLSTLVKSKFISKYGVNEVVKYVKDDLQVLSKDGLLIDGKDFAGKVRPQLFQVVGDNLGVHSLLGYVMSFSANYYCRFCKGHRSVLQKQMVEQQDLLRTQENYRVDINVNNVSQTGIRATSVLSEIEGYHVVENLAVDIMHDFAEGIVPLEMHLIIQRLIETRVFTLEELNSRILSYNYGFVDKKNKPNPFRQSQILNPSGASGQTAAQMVCLTIHLPLMIGDKINSSCQEWDLYLLLVEILKIVMSQSISMPATYMLKSLIKDHHELFLQLFPQRNLTPKQHIIIHYPRIIRELGPLRQYSSIRFEGKHKLFKQFANICNNFQNISKTLATKYQLAQCYDFLIEKPIDSEDVILSKEVITTIGNLEYSEKVAARLSCGMEDEIVVAGVAELHGYEFRESATVVMIWTEEGPTFGEVVCVLVRQKSVFLVLKPLKTLYYERHLQAYAVQHGVGTDVEIMQPCDLFDYRPLTAVQTHGYDCSILYIATRFSCV